MNGIQAFLYHLLEDVFISVVADHALIYAGAQKNITPSGLTMLIVRQGLFINTDAATKLSAVAVSYKFERYNRNALSYKFHIHELTRTYLNPDNTHVCAAFFNFCKY